MSDRLNPRSLFFVFILFGFFGFFSFASAQTSASANPLNAELLSNIWYSTTTINENDQINIYAGFQNHSDKNLSGTAGFYVDNLEINKIKFSISPKSLIKLDSPYEALSGNHTVQVKILDLNEVQGNSTLPLSVNDLLAFESEKSGLNVKYKITKDIILNKVNTIANTIVNSIDKSTENLANLVEDLKKPETPTSKVLGASTGSPQTTKDNKAGTGFSFLNTSIDILAFLLRHWIWTFVSLIFLILLFIFKKG